MLQQKQAALLQRHPHQPKLEEHVVTARTIETASATNVFHKPERDGVDHINIDNRGRTTLGQQLSHMHASQFLHPEYGPFESVEGFIGFVRSGATDDRFHWMAGMEARFHSRKLDSSFIRGFRELVMEASYFKIVQNQDLRDAFVESTLPFDHYYLLETNGRPIQPGAAGWVIPAFEQLRTMLRANETYPRPDYSGVELAAVRRSAPM